MSRAPAGGEAAGADELIIRAQRPGDRAAVRGVITAAFGSPQVAGLAEALQDGLLGGDPRYYSRLGWCCRLRRGVLGL